MKLRTRGAPAYQSGEPYEVGELFLLNGVVQRCTTRIPKGTLATTAYYKPAGSTPSSVGTVGAAVAADSNRRYFAENNTFTLPASPADGDVVTVVPTVLGSASSGTTLTIASGVAGRYLRVLGSTSGTATSVAVTRNRTNAELGGVGHEYVFVYHASTNSWYYYRSRGANGGQFYQSDFSVTKDADSNIAATFSLSALTASRTITVPDFNVDLAKIPAYATGMSNDSATIAGSSLTLSGTRTVVATGSAVTSGVGDAYGFIGTNHPTSPGNGGTVLAGLYNGALVSNNSNVGGASGFGSGTLTASLLIMRSTIQGLRNTIVNADQTWVTSLCTDNVIILGRYLSIFSASKMQVHLSAHGLSSFGSQAPVNGAVFHSNIMRSISTSLSKALSLNHVLTSTHGASDYLTVDGSQAAFTAFTLPAAVLGSKGIACHDVNLVLKQTSGTSDFAAHTSGSKFAVAVRRIRVSWDGTTVSSSIETVGTDFTDSGTTTVGFTVTFDYYTFSQAGQGWGQPLLKIQPQLIDNGTPVARSASAEVHSLYTINDWT